MALNPKHTQYSLRARTRVPRAPGYDQEFHVHESDDVELENPEFEWLPTKINDRLTVLAIADAQAYDEHVLNLASNPVTRSLVTEEQIADIRILPDLHQYREKCAFTKRNIAPGTKQHGTGNIDGFGVYCCEDCYEQAVEEEEFQSTATLKAGERSILQNGDVYPRLCNYNDLLKESIALRKEKAACMSEFIIMEKAYKDALQREDNPNFELDPQLFTHGSIPAAPSPVKAVRVPALVPPQKRALSPVKSVTVQAPIPAPVRPPSPAMVVTVQAPIPAREREPSPSPAPTFTDNLPARYRREAGHGCKLCPDLWFDRKLKGVPAMAKRSLEYHRDNKHPGVNVDDLWVRKYSDKPMRKLPSAATATATKRKRAEKNTKTKTQKEKKGGKEEVVETEVKPSLSQPPPKRRKVAKALPAQITATAVVAVNPILGVSAAVDPAVSRLCEEVLAGLSFLKEEDDFLNARTPFNGAGKLGLVHHAGIAAIRGAAFRSGVRRKMVEDATTGWWREEEKKEEEKKEK